ncbi:unnamed protein product [Blepharisma stoltei]|uniref:Mitogen-activated protein kinase n=1 Tax=Blepharisma stoltei TaxID=1481888 RepID=A0AAU9JWD2_9CILI|nr:unnamed protein product [Blepharisma stoltei]
MENRRLLRSYPENLYKNSQTNGPEAKNYEISSILGTTFELDRRYVILNVIGSGAYGTVVSATDSQNGQNAAVKRMEKSFENVLMAKRALRELITLRILNHENIIRIKTIQLPFSRNDVEEIYIVSELMEADLSTVIKSRQTLTDDQCQFFLYQLLRGLKYMHSANILHRDLKPRNILVNRNCDLKICDFGLARFVNNNRNALNLRTMSDYVATRWYRAPELLLSTHTYTAAMDVWSVGCIFGELLLRKPIFPGSDATNQLELIINALGSPSPEEIESIPHIESRETLKRMHKRTKKPLTMIIPNANPQALDLLEKLLAFSPSKRISISEALSHPYLSSFHCPEDEPICTEDFRYEFRFEDENLDIEDLKDLLYEEILLYHFPGKVEEYNKAKAEFLLKIN